MAKTPEKDPLLSVCDGGPTVVISDGITKLEVPRGAGEVLYRMLGGIYESMSPAVDGWTIASRQDLGVLEHRCGAEVCADGEDLASAVRAHVLSHRCDARR